MSWLSKATGIHVNVGKILTPKGTSALQSAQTEAQQQATLKEQWEAMDRARALSAQNTYAGNLQNLYTQAQGMNTSAVALPSYTPSSYNVNPETYATLGQTPDWQTESAKLGGAMGALSSSNLNTMAGQRNSALAGMMARRGLQGSSYEGSNAVGLENWRSKSAIDSYLPVLQAQQAAGQSLRNEGVSNTLAAQNLGYQENQTNEERQQQNYQSQVSQSQWQQQMQATLQQYLMNYLNSLNQQYGQLGQNTTPDAGSAQALQQALAAAQGQVNASQSMWGNIASLGGLLSSGGLLNNGRVLNDGGINPP